MIRIRYRSSGRALCSPGIAAAAVLGVIWLSSLAAQAQTYSVLYAFTGKPDDGAIANGSLVMDKGGNLYGTTWGGGAYDLGTVFKIDTTGKETVLTKFNYANGGAPQQGLTIDPKGNLYDSVLTGGYNGGGAVIRIDGTGKSKLLYSFCSLPNCYDGTFVTYGVTRDANGNMYGTTGSGGQYKQGVIFKIGSKKKETVLYSFCPQIKTCPGGTIPLSAGAMVDPAGNLYGVAQAGPNSADCYGSGYPCGVVWKLDTSGNESALHAFTGPPNDGASGTGLPIMDSAGNLYGVTGAGGSGTACGQSGCGTVYKIDASGNETVLHSFTGADGAYPGDQALVLDSSGNLFGTASSGGAHGKGVVFELAPSGQLQVLYSFQGKADGGTPVTGLLLDKNGVIYGEASAGGNFSNCSESKFTGCGVVFKITP